MSAVDEVIESEIERVERRGADAGGVRPARGRTDCAAVRHRPAPGDRDARARLPGRSRPSHPPLACRAARTETDLPHYVVRVVAVVHLTYWREEERDRLIGAADSSPADAVTS